VAEVAGLEAEDGVGVERREVRVAFKSEGIFDCMDNCRIKFKEAGTSLDGGSRSSRLHVDSCSRLDGSRTIEKCCFISFKRFTVLAIRVRVHE